MHEDLLPYYERELTALRRLGAEFAKHYPKVAGRLQLEADACDDPHVERLLEAFAFLSARVRRKIDDEFPEITEALLGILYPHYLRPIPSMAVVQFQVDPVETPFTSRADIPRGTPLHSRAVQGMQCRFRTCYPVELWPITVVEAKVEAVERSPFAMRREEAAAVVRIRLRCGPDLTFEKLRPPRLRFCLAGEGSIPYDLHELILNSGSRVRLIDRSAGKERFTDLPEGSLRPVGFERDEGMLEYEPRSFLGYRLLHEYFAFPDKFLFVDVANLAAAADAGFGGELEIAVFLREFEREGRLAELSRKVGAANFRLGCTPAVNLFPHVAEPIRVTHTEFEHPVTPDYRRPWGMEVYSIESVRRVVRERGGEASEELEPFYGLRHALSGRGGTAFWYAARRPSDRKDDPGSQVVLSLVDLAFDPAKAAEETLSVATLCTNRDLPSQPTFRATEGSDFTMEGSPFVTRIRCVRNPTPPAYPPLRGGAQWRLVSHLALNHLSIVEGGRDALLEILALYNFKDSAALRRQIEGVVKVASRPVTERVGSARRAAFVRGVEVSIEFDEDPFAGGGVYLLACVLERFLGLYCGANGFTKLVVTTKQRERALAAWPPRTGDAIVA